MLRARTLHMSIFLVISKHIFIELKSDLPSIAERSIALAYFWCKSLGQYSWVYLRFIEILYVKMNL